MLRSIFLVLLTPLVAATTLLAEKPPDSAFHIEAGAFEVRPGATCPRLSGNAGFQKARSSALADKAPVVRH